MNKFVTQITQFFRPGRINSPTDGYRELAVAIILHAFVDLIKGEDDDSFFKTSFFDSLCSGIGIDTIEFLERLMATIMLPPDIELGDKLSLFTDNSSVSRCVCLELIFWDRRNSGGYVECDNCGRLWTIEFDGTIRLEE